MKPTPQAASSVLLPSHSSSSFSSPSATREPPMLSFGRRRYLVEAVPHPAPGTAPSTASERHASFDLTADQRARLAEQWRLFDVGQLRVERWRAEVVPVAAPAARGKFSARAVLSASWRSTVQAWQQVRGLLCLSGPTPSDSISVRSALSDRHRPLSPDDPCQPSWSPHERLPSDLSGFLPGTPSELAPRSEPSSPARATPGGLWLQLERPALPSPECLSAVSTQALPGPLSASTPHASPATLRPPPSELGAFGGLRTPSTASASVASAPASSRSSQSESETSPLVPPSGRRRSSSAALPGLPAWAAGAKLPVRRSSTQPGALRASWEPAAGPSGDRGPRPIAAAANRLPAAAQPSPASPASIEGWASMRQRSLACSPANTADSGVPSLVHSASSTDESWRSDGSPAFLPQREPLPRILEHAHATDPGKGGRRTGERGNPRTAEAWVGPDGHAHPLPPHVLNPF